jgi:hypothetical protein
MIRTGTFVSIHALPVNQTVTSPSLSVDDDEDSEAHQSPSRFSARWLRLALSAQAHQVCTEKTRRWHSMLAGTLSGGLVLIEKRLRMWSSQTTFCSVLSSTLTMKQCSTYKVLSRGLQGSHNAFTSKHGFHLPNGEVLIFCLWYWSCNILEGFVPTCMPTAVHGSCTLSFLGQRRCRDHTRHGVFS